MGLQKVQASTIVVQTKRSLEEQNFQVEKKENGIAGEREENPVMEAVRSKSFK